MSINLSRKIDVLSQKLGQLKAQKQQADALQRARSIAANRKAETRRKILLGAFLLDTLGVASAKQLELQGKRFEEWLTRPEDHTLFGFHSSPTGLIPAPQAAATEGDEG